MSQSQRDNGAAGAAADIAQQGPPRLHGARDRRRARRVSAAVGYVVSIAASAPPLTSLKAQAIAGQQHRASTPPTAALGFIPADELHLPVDAPGHPAGPQGRDRRDRGRALLQAPGRRLRGRRARGASRTSRRARRSRAARRSRCSSCAPLHLRASATYQRKIREAKLAEELEDEHSKEWILEQVPRHDPVRHGRRAVGDRRQGRGADLLLQARSRSSTCTRRRCSPACRRRRRTTRRCAARAAAKRRRNEVLRKMAELGMITHGRPRPGDAARARPQASSVLHPPPREVLLRLRQGPADQASTARSTVARAA